LARDLGFVRSTIANPDYMEKEIEKVIEGKSNCKKTTIKGA